MYPTPKTMLLTGATGFVGRYLLRDLLLRGRQVIVLTRGRGPVSGQDRIEAILQDWELRLGRRLLRPRFIDGNVCLAGLGIVKNQITSAMLNSVDAVVHCAASLRFEEDEAREEPLRTNLTGTRNVVAFAQENGIPHFHYISTAYVCGQRHERIRETDLDLGQAFHNIYEQSKFQAEQFVHAATGFESKTIYRPSIVVGDSVTGFSSTFHTIYSILRFLRALPESNAGNLDWIFQKLQLSGNEGKNLVPVDWVSRATVELLGTPAAWGQTYHLTNAVPVTAKQLSLAIGEAIGLKQSQWDSMALPASITDAQAAYQMHVDAYRGYLADDPIFDSSNLQKMLPDLAASKIYHEMLVRLLSFAIENRFRDPTIVIPRTIDDGGLRSVLDRAWQNDTISVASSDTEISLGWTLRISGLGGGVWQFGNPEMPDDGSLRPWAHLSSEAWNALSKMELLLNDAIRSRRVLVVGTSDERQQIKEKLGFLLSWCDTNRSQPDSSDDNDQPSVLPLHNSKGGRRFA